MTGGLLIPSLNASMFGWPTILDAVAGHSMRPLTALRSSWSAIMLAQSLRLPAAAQSLRLPAAAQSLRLPAAPTVRAWSGQLAHWACGGWGGAGACMRLCLPVHEIPSLTVVNGPQREF
jgi:hypothetical protein